MLVIMMMDHTKDASVRDSNIRFVEFILHNLDDAQKKREVALQYQQSIAPVSPESNICEQLFSKKIKIIMRSRRRHMDPLTLEMILKKQ